MTRPQPRYKPGDKIGGRYQVHQVKMGGMGEVYLCLDLQENYPYALKTFQQRYQSTALRKAFEQEVATWVALEKHPNIVRCFYMDILDNQPFMVLEWIAGEEGKGADLRGWLRHGPLDLKTALQIIIDVVRGLIHAQEKQPGLVHRDLKPENILVAQGGLAKITDFGLAQIVENAGLEVEGETDGRQSMVGKEGIAGTPAYMAPEQWRGDALDERTDIYAVGCILYEMLTSRWPFRVTFSPTTPRQFQQWLIAMQSGHESEPPPALPADLPRSVSELVSGCLAKSPSARPAPLHDLIERLSRLYDRQFHRPPPSRTSTVAFNAVDYNNRALTYKNLKRHDQALVDYGRAIDLDPTYATAYSNRGNTFHELQRYDEALADYERAIDLDPNDAQAYSNRGLTCHDLQRYDEALANYSRAIDLDLTFAQAYGNRGITFHELQRYDEALTNYSRAIDLDPTYATAYSNRGNTLHELQRYDEALVDYNRAIDLDPTFAQAYYNRGNTYHTIQRNDEALADYSRAINLDLTFAQAYYNRGITLHELQRYAEALVDYDRAINLDPTFAQAYYNRGNTYHTIQRNDEALADYSRAINLDLTFAQASYNRGNTYAELQRYEEALADYDRAIKLDPTLTQAHFNLGALLANTGQLRESLPYFEQAVRLGHPQASQVIAQVRQRLGGTAPTPQPDPAQSVFDAFQHASSVEAMRQAVAQFPSMVQLDFIATIEQAIAQQVPREHRPAFEQHLSWLCQIAEEQTQ